MAIEKKGYVHAAIAVAIIGVVYLILKLRNANRVNLPEPLPSGPDFMSPYYYTNPGIDDSSVNGGGPVFNATNTINVNTGNIPGLSNAYMPLFGLVGVTAIGA